MNLFKPMLSAMPVHSMLALDMPARSLKDMIKTCRGFLWKGSNLRAWDKVCMTKDLSGLGIRNLRLLNIALHAKIVVVAAHGG